MSKKVIVYSLLLSFVNFLFGCSVYRPAAVELADLNKDQKIMKVVTSSGETVKYDASGGFLLDTRESIIGVHNGKAIAFDTDSIIEYRTKIYPVLSLESAIGKRLHEIIANGSRLIQFDDEGGTYSPDTKSISGRTIKGKDIALPVKSVTSMFEKPDTVSLSLIRADSTLKIAQIITTNKNLINFKKDSGKYLREGRYIIGLTDESHLSTISLDDILTVEILKYNGGLSLLSTCAGGAAVLLGIALIVAVTKESCPFIYSYDGSQYIFDGEPLGGATSEIHQRSELSRLEHLRAVDGKYVLAVTNEVNETQFIDALTLEYIDHSPEYKIYPSGQEYFLVRNAEQVISCKDENSRDIRNFVIAEDGTSWMTHMTGQEATLKDKIRHQITVTLPKPANAEKVNLIVNAGTTLWGSNMIREMLNMYGNEVNKYYENINKGDNEYRQTMNFLEKEELFQLKIFVQAGGDWKYKGLINGGGPLSCETRIIQLDVSDVPGDSLLLRFNPPVGFWCFDYIAADYDIRKIDRTSTLKFTKIYDNDNSDISDLLKADDRVYYSMPDKDMKIIAEFDAPVLPEGKTRTVFANTSGYYKIHTDNSGPKQTYLLYRLVLDPGYIVKLSTQKYYEWAKEVEKTYMAKKLSR